MIKSMILSQGSSAAGWTWVEGTFTLTAFHAALTCSNVSELSKERRILYCRRQVLTQLLLVDLRTERKKEKMKSQTVSHKSKNT